MESARTSTEKLTIQHERNPRDGVPVARMICDKRPAQVCDSDPAQDMSVRSDIFRIVEADELGMKHRLVNEPGNEGEPQTNEHRLPQPFHAEFTEGSVFPHVRVDPNLSDITQQD